MAEKQRKWFLPAYGTFCAALGLLNIAYGNVWFPGVPCLAIGVLYFALWLSKG
jgi:hypothetical protein